MMEAMMRRGKATPNRLRVYCDKQWEGRKDDSIREKKIEQYTHMDERGKKSELLKH
jgi:hypothetical protein